MPTAAVERLQVETDLPKALDQGQFELRHQPVVDLMSGRITAFEALLRWNHPTLGQILPDRFIPVAEASGAITPIGAWVLEEACRTAARWRRHDPDGPQLRMAVNVLGRQLAEAELVEDVELATSCGRRGATRARATCSPTRDRPRTPRRSSLAAARPRGPLRRRARRPAEGRRQAGGAEPTDLGPPHGSTVSSMGRFERTWRLAKGSWAILRQDKELAWIPVLSAVVTMAVAVAFIAPFWLVSDGSAADGEGFQPGAMGYLLLVLGYVVVTFVATYFNGALTSGALERLRGGDPTLGSALRGAAAHFHRLAPWAVLAATFGLIIQAIENIRVVGPIIRSLLGVAWNLITYLTIPILIVEDLGPVAGLKRSASLFRQTWGENVIAQFGFGLIGIVAALPGLLVGGVLIATGADALVVAGIGLCVVSVVLVMVVVGALDGIFRTALYLYAAEGTVIPEYGPQGLTAAFRPK